MAGAGDQHTFDSGFLLAQRGEKSLRLIVMYDGVFVTVDN